jgi:hypothetical protein
LRYLKVDAKNDKIDHQPKGSKNLSISKFGAAYSPNALYFATDGVD